MKTKDKTVTMDSNELQKALQKVNCIPKNWQQPVLSNALVECNKGKTTITSTDLERHIKVELNNTSDNDFSILLPRKTSEKFLSGANGKTSIIYEPGNTINLSRNDIGSVNFLVTPVRDFPPLPTMPSNLEWHRMDSKWLCSMLYLVSKHCAKELSRPVLSGIACNDGKIAAADGFRLAIFRNDKLAFGLGTEQAIIPLDTINLVNRLFNKSDTIDISFEYIGESLRYVYFKSESTLVVSELIQGNYPNYEPLVPKEFKTKVSFSAPLLAQRLNMIDDNYINGHIVRYIFATTQQNEQACSLVASSYDSEDGYNISCPVKFDGFETKISFNYTYIMEAIKPFSVCSLEITTGSSPGKITGDIEGLTIVIMPMFVKW